MNTPDKSGSFGAHKPGSPDFLDQPARSRVGPKATRDVTPQQLTWLIASYIVA
jgi:hypothetical protein